MTAQTATLPISLQEFRKSRVPLNPSKWEMPEQVSNVDKLATYVTESVGSIRFFVIIFAWTVLWLGWNTLAPKELQFDPPSGFVFWLFISNVIQLFLMPLIMIGQNVQGRHADARAEHDLQINIRAEKEIEVILEHLEYQNEILISMMEKMNLGIDDALSVHYDRPSKEFA